jgi:hypothetical protein
MNKGEIARLHIRALPNTWNSRKGPKYMEWLYGVVAKLGYFKIVRTFVPLAQITSI